MSVINAFNKIKNFAESLIGDARVVDECPVGYFVRQGDVYATRISEFDRESYKLSNDIQLAPGTSKGARHTVHDSVKVYRSSQTGDFEENELGLTVFGPIIESSDRFSIMHIEHDDISLPPGIYQISYQVDPVTLRRIID